MPKLLGIDPGQRWVGLATSDESRAIASPYRTLDRHEVDLLKTLRSIVQTENVDRIIVGYPDPLKVSENERTRQVDQFISEFVVPLEQPHETISERYSTKEARRKRHQRKQEGPPPDEEAAAVILQSYLDINNTDQPPSTPRDENNG